MSKNRRIPFGYCMKNGEMIVENKEAETVRKIFDSYISGKSLLAIARELQIVDVPYNPDEENMWNKNMRSISKMKAILLSLHLRCFKRLTNARLKKQKM